MLKSCFTKFGKPVLAYLLRRPRFAGALDAEPVSSFFKRVVQQRRQYDNSKEMKLLCNLLT